MSEDLAFFDLLMDSSVFVAAVDAAKEHFRETVKEVKAGTGQMSRDMAIAENAVKQATAAMAAQRAEAASERFAAGKITQPSYALAQARSQKAGLEAKVSEEELSKKSGGSLAGLAPQLALFGGLGLLGAAGGGLALLDNLVNSTAKHSAEVLRNSQAIGLNHEQMQVWDEIAKKVGLDEETLIRSVGHFNVQIASGAPALKAAGIDLKDLGITSNDTGQALLQAADYFHTHTDAVQNDQIAMALFGRQGLAMLPILSQGSQAIRDYGDELKRMGLIFTDSELATGAATEVVHQKFMESLQALEGQLAVHLEPAFIQLYQTISAVTINGRGLFDALADGVAHAVSFIAGMIAGLTGTKVDFGAGAAQDAGGAFDGLGGSAANASGAIDGTRQSAGGARDALAGLREETRLATDALDDQITALQNEKQAYDDQVQAQQDALQDQLDTVTNVTEGQRRQGEDIVSYRRRLAADDLKNQIKALGEEKTHKDRAYEEQVKALEQQKSALQRHLADEQAAVSAATGSMAQDYADAFGSAGGSASDFAATVKTTLSGIKQDVFDSGSQIGADMRGWFSGNPPAGAKTLGNAIGKSIAEGILDAFWYDLVVGPVGRGGWQGQVWKMLESALIGWGSSGASAPYIPPATPGNGTLGSYALGGIITRPQIALLGEGGGPEVVIPLNNPPRAAALMRAAGLDRAGGGGGGVTQTVNFNGPVATEYVAGSIAARLARDAQQKSLALRAGLG